MAAHYQRSLNERLDAERLRCLRQQLADPHTPAVLRLELGKVLQFFQELDQPLLEMLIEPSNPGSLRLIACETLLADHVEGVPRDQAISALRDLARLPNREIALATADVVQRRLGLDLGLGLGQPLPPVQSRQAAEITRRVMHWATQFAEEQDLDSSLPSPVRA